MAHRRLSRGKGKRREGDSYDPSPFSSSENALRYPSFETKNVHKGNHIDLSELGDLKPISWFANLDILSILQISEPIYPRLVRLFYTNLSVDKDYNVSTYLLGNQISITDSIICSLIGISKKRRGCYFRG
ncbi:unnamed protein product [Musa textilis]